MDMLFLQAGGAATIMQFAPLLMIAVVFYFFMIRPQATRQKQQDAFLGALEKGQDVVTSSGIIGKINKIEGGVVTLQIANNVFIRVTKGAVSREMTEAMANNTTVKDEVA